MNRDSLYLAFYRGRSFFPSRMIRWVTWSNYSHVAMIVCREDGGMDLYDAWFRGGVRCVHKLKEGHDPTTRVDLYEFVEPLKQSEIDAAVMAARKDLGKGYDWRGVISQLFRIRCHDKGRLFCSEAVLLWLQSAGRLLVRIAPDQSSPAMVSGSAAIQPVSR